jgi:hypothetical protein
LEQQLLGLKPVFRCNVLQADHVPLEHHFHEFQINTGPHPEDLLDDIEGLPDLLDIEESDCDEEQAVPLTSMRKFATRSRRFMDAYEQGLNRWAARKYRGHPVLPVSIMDSDPE